MDIEKIIEREAPKYKDGDTHDENYAKYLMRAYEDYKDFSLDMLQNTLGYERQNYASTHRSTANCIVLYELVKEKKGA